jgi:hypothetical protein
VRVVCQPLYEGDTRETCGKVYDDAECLTICPHEPLGGRAFIAPVKTEEEEATPERLDQIIDLATGEAREPWRDL